MADDPFPRLYQALEARHRANLTFQEIRRAVQALSSLYVERRERLGRGSVFEGAGKRAAFALFFGPLHFLLVREIVRGLGAGAAPLRQVLDLGCGTGVAGAAWALECASHPTIDAVDASGWAANEARFTLKALGLRGVPRRGDLALEPLPRPPCGVILAFAVNELREEVRESLLARLLHACSSGVSALVIEPLAKRQTPWWPAWESAFRNAGGRQDSWRFRIPLPEGLALLDRAAALDHRELSGRSLWLPGRAARAAQAEEGSRTSRLTG
jgi:hypothetical protein